MGLRACVAATLDGMPTVALLPHADGSPLPGFDLTPRPFTVSAVPAGIRWPAHVAGQLAGTRDDLVLVFFGEAAVHAPALGLARRALRRPAVGYVLVDPRMPTIGGEYGDWPDAPVTVVLRESAPDYARDAAMQARLRGWTVTPNALHEVLRGW